MSAMKMRASYQSPRANAHNVRQAAPKLTKISSRSNVEQQRSFNRQLTSERMVDYDDMDQDPVDISSLNLSEIQHKLSDIHDENKLLKINLNNEMSIRQRLERKNSDLNEKLNDARQGLQETRNALLKVQQATEQMITKRDQRENQLKKVIAINKSYENRISELEEKLTKSTEASKLTSKLTTSKQAMQEKDAMIGDLEDQLAELQSQLGISKRENKRLSEEKRDFEFLLESAEKKILMLQSGVKLMDKKNQLTAEHNELEASHQRLLPLTIGSGYTDSPANTSVSMMSPSPLLRTNSNLLQQQQGSPDVDFIHKLVETKLSSFLDERRTLEQRMVSLEAMLRESQSKAELLDGRNNAQAPISVAFLTQDEMRPVLTGSSTNRPTPQNSASNAPPVKVKASETKAALLAPVAAPVVLTPVAPAYSSSSSSSTTTGSYQGGSFSISPDASPLTKSRKVVSSEPVSNNKFAQPQQYLNDALAAVTSSGSSSGKVPTPKAAKIPLKQSEVEQIRDVAQVVTGGRDRNESSSFDAPYVTPPVVAAPVSILSPALTNKTKKRSMVSKDGGETEESSGNSRVSFMPVQETAVQQQQYQQQQQQQQYQQQQQQQ